MGKDELKRNIGCPSLNKFKISQKYKTENWLGINHWRKVEFTYSLLTFSSPFESSCFLDKFRFNLIGLEFRISDFDATGKLIFDLSSRLLFTFVLISPSTPILFAILSCLKNIMERKLEKNPNSNWSQVVLKAILRSKTVNFLGATSFPQYNLGNNVMHKSSKQGFLKFSHTSQPAFTCSKLTIETLEQGVRYV